MKVVVQVYEGTKVEVFEAQEDTYAQIKDLMLKAGRRAGYRISPSKTFKDYTEEQQLEKYGKVFFETPDPAYGRGSEISINREGGHASLAKDGFYRGNTIHDYFSWYVREIKKEG